MEVIKLGGSLYSSDRLRTWLTALSQLAQHQTVIVVPGGGPFADQVRAAQRNYGFDDITAHQMAILAMQQYGRLLLSLNDSAVGFTYPAEATPQDQRLNIWLPNETLFTVPELENSWRVTSDSLSLWLAHQLRADHLTLVKSCDIHSTALPALIQSGQIDAAFAEYYPHCNVSCSLIEAHQADKFLTTRRRILAG